MAVRSAGTLYYTYTDHLGNVAALSNTAGAFTNGSLARYDPFGNFRTTPTTNPGTTSHGFTGHRHNNTGVYPTQNVGLIYMNARYYLPEVGRFISPDTIVPEPGNPQSYNRYAYTYNNPANYVDPTGHLTEEEVLEYFGFSSREEMIKAGWGEFLVNWLWNPDVTWGDVFTYNNGEGEAMLVLFEAQSYDSGQYTGGFYRLNGEKYGTQLSFSSIHALNDDTPKATALEERYYNKWASLPVRPGTNGTPYYVPAAYVNIATKGVLGAGASVLGGAALTGCALLEPCGVIAGGTAAATVLTSAGAAFTITGALIATYDALSTDVSLTHIYPVILNPEQAFPGPQQAWPYHMASPRGVYR